MRDAITTITLFLIFSLGSNVVWARNHGPEVSNIRAVPYSPAILPCHFVSEEKWSVSGWFRDSIYFVLPNEASEKYLILPNGNLLIWQVSAQDFYSKFQCRVETNSGDEYLSTEGRIIKQSFSDLASPVIQTMAGEVIVSENQLVVIPCLAIGNPKVAVNWWKRGKGGFPPLPLPTTAYDDFRFDETPNKIRVKEGILLIPSAKRIHSGSYICNATNSIGSETREVTLIVRMSVGLRLSPAILTVSLGKTAEFTCTSNDKETSIHWLKDGEPIGESVGPGRVRLSGPRLSISPVLKEDQGIYACVGQNSMESEQKMAELRLGDSKPLFLYTFIQQTVLPGAVISLRCKGAGWPVPMPTWFLDGFSLPLNERFLLGESVVEDVVTSYLNITTVSPADSGEYSCVLRNSVGEISHSNRINVYGDISIRPMPQIVAVFGKSLKLKCPVGGWPIDLIIWSLGTTKLPKSVHQKVSPDGVLILENVIKEDGGTYQCTAFRQTQTVHGLVTVEVVVVPSITPFQFGDPVSGERVSVLCSLTDDLSDVRIDWYRDSFPISTSDSIRVNRIDEVTSSLSIPSLSPEFNGNYTCRISSASHPHVATNWTSTLVVNVPPRITKFNFEESIVEGMKVQALCFSQGDLPLRFKWYRDEETFPLPSSKADGFEIASFGENSEILTIESVRAEMSGVLSCSVTNRAGKAVHAANLVVKVPPKFVIEPEDLGVTVESRVRIPCTAEGRPETRIKWLREVRSGDFRPVETMPGIRNINGTLTFTRVNKEHGGVYVCQATNDVGPPISKRIQLSVNAPPRIRSKSTKEVVEVGQVGRLRCVFDGDPPITISWKFNGEDVRSNGGNRTDAQLKITNVQRSDGGDYTCFGLNEYGHDYNVISLIVQEQPSSPINLRSLRETSRSVTLTWSVLPYADSYLLDFVLRRRSGNENWTTGLIVGHERTTTVNNLLPFTTYEFTISARNQVGLSHPSEVLRVKTGEEEPSPPRHLTVEEVGTLFTEIRVSWVRPEFPNGLISHYTVFYAKSSDTYGRTKYRNVPPTRSIINIRGLESYVQYGILVRAVNGAGNGQNSSLIQVQTREGRPSFGPEDVFCQGFSSKSLQISWKIPKQPHNGFIRGFRLSLNLMEEDGGKDSELESEVSGTSTVITGLRENAEYSIMVSAFTSQGSGPPSRPTFCKTKETLPPPPPDIKLIELNGYAILSWSYPTRRSNESLRKFHVYVRTRNEGQILKKAVLPTTQRYELKHLTHDSTYEACVTAENGIGEGNPSRTVSFHAPRPEVMTVQPTILSFGHRVFVPWKSDVVLECDYLGLTEVNLLWKKDGQLLPQWTQESFHLRNVNGKDSGNYTCLLMNMDGTKADSITHTLLVQVPPPPPLLQVRRFSSNGSTLLIWKQERIQHTSCRLLGYNLNYRSLESGEWEEELGLDKKTNSYEFPVKNCFTSTYEVFLTAYNKFGTSLPSERVQLELEGLFRFPPDSYATTISNNSSTISLNFSAWNVWDCENGLIVVEYRGVEEHHWILASLSNWTQTVLIKDLLPDREYALRVKVQSENAEVETEFRVTLSQSPLLSENLIYNDVTLILPLAFALIAISSALGGILVFWWRRRKVRKSSRSQPFISYPMHEKRERDYTIIRKKHVEDSERVPENADEINPYATFDMCDGGGAPFQNARHHELYYGHGNSLARHPLDSVDYMARNRRQLQENSNTAFFEMDSTTMVVGDKRKSLPRRSQECPNLYLQSGAHAAHWERSPPEQEVIGANLVTRKGKRRKGDNERLVGYTCPHNHMFINV